MDRCCSMSDRTWRAEWCRVHGIEWLGEIVGMPIDLPRHSCAWHDTNLGEFGCQVVLEDNLGPVHYSRFTSPAFLAAAAGALWTALDDSGDEMSPVWYRGPK